MAPLATSILLARRAFALLKADGQRLHHVTALDCGLTLSGAICGLLLGCLILSLLCRRSSRLKRYSSSFGVLGLCVLPMLLVPVADLTILDYSQRTEFCGSCHSVMQPFVDDLQNPKSRALAATHYRAGVSKGSECYGCHANDGPRGMVEAKLIGLRDTYAYVARSYKLPLTTAEPFPNQLCLKCHQGSEKFMTIDSHLEADNTVSRDLLTNATRCNECHGPGHQLVQTSASATGNR